MNIIINIIKSTVWMCTAGLLSVLGGVCVSVAIFIELLLRQKNNKWNPLHPIKSAEKAQKLRQTTQSPEQVKEQVKDT